MNMIIHVRLLRRNPQLNNNVYNYKIQSNTFILVVEVVCRIQLFILDFAYQYQYPIGIYCLFEHFTVTHTPGGTHCPESAGDANPLQLPG